MFFVASIGIWGRECNVDPYGPRTGELVAGVVQLSAAWASRCLKHPSICLHTRFLRLTGRGGAYVWNLKRSKVGSSRFPQSKLCAFQTPRLEREQGENTGPESCKETLILLSAWACIHT